MPDGQKIWHPLAGSQATVPIPLVGWGHGVHDFPQLFVETSLMQAPPQSCVPPAHTHAAPLQRLPPEHTTPQAPQLSLSVCSLTHAPPQSVGALLGHPEMHA